MLTALKNKILGTRLCKNDQQVNSLVLNTTTFAEKTCSKKEELVIVYCKFP